MQKRSLRQWDSKPELEGLVFFVQRMEEMLFPYTNDSFRPPVMTTRSVCREALQLVASIKAGDSKRPSLKPVLEELAWAMEDDSAAQVLIGDAARIVSKDLVGDKLDLNDIQARLEYISAALPRDEYLAEIRRQLLDAIAASSQKERIDSLARTLVAHLSDAGYKYQEMYVALVNYFHRKQRIRKPSDLVGYLDNFDLSVHGFEVLVRLAPLFRKVSGVLKKIAPEEWDVRLVDEWDGQDYGKRLEDFLETNDQGKGAPLLHVRGIQARCSSEANEQVRGLLLFLANSVAYVHHHSRLTWSDRSCVLHPEKNLAVVVTPAPSGMERHRDGSVEGAIKRLDAIFTTRMSEASLTKYFRVFDLHEMALQTEEPANQLLDLWATLETVVPSLHDVERPQIQRILKSLVPLIIYPYTTGLLRVFLRDLKRWNEDYAESVLKTIPVESENPIIRLAGLVAAEECEDVRLKLCEQLDDYVLLRNRFFQMNKSLSNTRAILRLLETHQQRVEWQLFRIYRTRNEIVHSGRQNPNTSLLVANLHSYIDSVIDVSLGCQLRTAGLTKLEGALVHAGTSLELQVESLKGARGTECTLAAYRGFVFPEGCVVV